MIAPENRLRIYAAVQVEFGSSSLAKVICRIAATFGVETALLELNRILADPRVQDNRPAC